MRVKFQPLSLSPPDPLLLGSSTLVAPTFIRRHLPPLARSGTHTIHIELDEQLEGWPRREGGMGVWITGWGEGKEVKAYRV